MANLDPHLLLLLIGGLYILVFGALSLLRREGLSAQFALEGLGVTGILVGGTWAAGLALSPLLFLPLLYLITMRSRLLVDGANLLAQRGKYPLAFHLYRIALSALPDLSTRLIILANQGAALLRCGQVDVAITMLEGVLRDDLRPRLGLKYEAVTHFNLGLAYEESAQGARASQHYNEAIDLLPGSPCAHAARARLERRKSGRPPA